MLLIIAPAHLGHSNTPWGETGDSSPLSTQLSGHEGKTFKMVISLFIEN
jgi:hypothetical protein